MKGWQRMKAWGATWWGGAARSQATNDGDTLSPSQLDDDDAPNGGAGRRRRAQALDEKQRHVCAAELDHLRAAMRERANANGRAFRDSASATLPGASQLPASNLPLLEKINALEAQTLGEAATPAAPTARRAALPANEWEPHIEYSDLGAQDILNEISVLFATGMQRQAAELLGEAIRQHGSHHEDEAVWLALLDLWRVTGEQDRFASLAQAFSARFGEPCGLAWPTAAWHAPRVLTQVDAAQLQQYLAAHRVEPVLDWSRLEAVSPQASTFLHAAIAGSCALPCTVHHVQFTRLANTVLQQSQGAAHDRRRWWELRLALLRWLGKEELYERIALQYSVQFEMSAPAWQAPQCRSRLQSPQRNARAAAPEPARAGDAPAAPQVVNLKLSGEILASAPLALHPLQRLPLTPAVPVVIDCAELLRLDFSCGASVLNWVRVRAGGGQPVSFVNAHRLLAQFLRMLGVGDYAQVSLLK